MDSMQINCWNGTLIDIIINIFRCLISSTSENDDENQESPRTQRSRGKANQVPTYFDNSEKHHRLFQIDGINP